MELWSDTAWSCGFTIQVADCDKAFERALAAGGSPLSPSHDPFWDSRTAMIRDPFGYRWSFSQHLEDVPPDELIKTRPGLYERERQLS